MSQSVSHTHHHIPGWVYRAMLILAAAIWGLGTVVIKDTIDTFPPCWLVGIRFTSAGIILAIVFWKQTIKHLTLDHILPSFILGVLLALSYGFNSTGLTDTTASKSAFLTATYCILVPFISWAAMKQRPRSHNILAAILCLVGIWFVSMNPGEGLTLSFGDAMTLGSAFFLGLHLTYVSKYAPGRDMAVLTAFQFIVSGVLTGIFGAFTEPWPTSESFNLETILNLGYLIIFASCIALMLQNVGLAHVAPAPGALLLATESVFGVVFSVIFLGDVLSARLLIGFLFIGVGIVISEIAPLLRSKKAPTEKEIEEAGSC